MKKILMFFAATALVFGFVGVTGATQFTLSDIDNFNSDLSVDLTASAGDPVWAPKWNHKPPKHKPPKHKPPKNIAPIPVPEPSTMLLLGFGLVGLAVVGRKRIH